MRPLLPAAQPGTSLVPERGADAVPVLLDLLGPYCSICERPLLEEAFPWDPLPGALVSPYRAEPPSPGCLLLCATCAEAQVPHEVPTAELELPDEAVVAMPDVPGATTTGHGYSYGPDGSMTGLGAAARRTIAYFDLDRPPTADPRARLRGEVAVMAVEAVPRLEAGGSSELLWLAQLVSTTGFLSVWLSALGRWSGARALEPFAVQANEAVPSFYPGTDWARLLPPRHLLA